MSPKVSAIIVCMNRTDNLIPCLDSLLGHTAVEMEVIVTAYMFSPENLSAMQERYPSVKFVESDEIRGFSENNNLALRQAQGEFCFILNDDTVVCEDALDRLCDDLSRLPSDAAIVTPRLLNPDGSLQLCGRPEYPPYKYALQQWHLYREPKDDTLGKKPVFDKVYRTSNISGAAFLIKTEIFRELGFFDERYFFTPEDIALSTLARSRGYGVYVDGGASVIHKWRTSASPLAPAVRPSAVKGSLLFFGGRHPLPLKISVFLSEACKELKARLLLALGRGGKKELETFSNIRREIFSPLTPKEIFIKYYRK